MARYLTLPLQKGWRPKVDGVVSASHGRISSKTHLRSAPNITLVFSHKFHLCENPPLLQEGEYPRSACKSAGNLDRSALFIYVNGITKHH